MPYRPTAPEIRFADKYTMDPATGCWLWLGAKKPSGYGNFQLVVGAHVASHVLHKGPVPAGAFVCHGCDRPSCVNPAHLSLGTPKSNRDEMRAKGRGKFNRRFAPHEVIEMRALRRGGAPLKSLGLRFGISEGTVSLIVRSKIYRHIKEAEFA